MGSCESLSRDFERAMRDACAESTKLGYYPHLFIRMLDERGGVGAVKHLLRSDEIQYGLARLWEMNALRLSAEAHVLQAKWACLFTDAERAEARRRLDEYGYRPQD